MDSSKPHRNPLWKNIFSSADIFSLQIGFTHGTRPQFKSSSSGIFSVLTVLCILSYFMYLAKDIWNFKVGIKNTMMKRDLIFDNTTFDLQEQNFDFALSIQYLSFNASRQQKMLRFFSLNAFAVTVFQETTEQGIRMGFTQDPIELELCTDSAFKNDTKYLERMGVVGNYFCPTTKNFTLKGATQSDSYQSVSISVATCSQELLEKFYPGEVCADLEEQIEVASSTLAQIILTNQYFQGENKLEPIQQDYKLLTVGVPLRQFAYTQVKYSVNYAILQDSWMFDSFNERNMSYSSVRVDQQYSKAFEPLIPQSPFMMINIMLDETVNINVRTAFNLITALQSLGGFSSICMIIASVVFKATQQFNYYSEMISQCYSYEIGTQNKAFDNASSSRKNNMSQRGLQESVRDGQDLEQDENQMFELIKKVTAERLITQTQKIGFCSYLTLKCRQSSKEAKHFRLAKALFQDELNLQRFIQSMRMLDLYLQLKLTPLQQTILKALSRKLPLSLVNSFGYLEKRVSGIAGIEERDLDPQIFQEALSSLINLEHVSKFDRNLASYLGFKVLERNSETQLVPQKRKKISAKVKVKQKAEYQRDLKNPSLTFLKSKKSTNYGQFKQQKNTSSQLEYIESPKQRIPD